MGKLGIALSFALWACSPGKYECGTSVSGSSEFHECNRTNEVCICTTHSCAFRQADTTECPSGYKYADEPFVSDEALANQCVPMELVADRIEATGEIKKCAAPRDAGVDATDAMGGES